MTDNARGNKSDTPDGFGGWSLAVDNSLTWVAPKRSASSYAHLQWWPGLEQQLVDFHARYERACIED
jgi:hypothetical protein